MHRACTIVVETRFALGLPPVEADANQLEAALLNLAVNARDAMDGAGTIVIATHERWVQDTDGPVRPGHYVRLSLSDSGAGMDEATLKRAIEPFFTTKGVGKGTGLGLSMVHGILRKRMRRIRYVGNSSPENWKAAMREHDGFIAALKARDGARLGQLMREHLENTWPRVSSVMAAPDTDV